MTKNQKMAEAEKNIKLAMDRVESIAVHCRVRGANCSPSFIKNMAGAAKICLEDALEPIKQ